MNQISFQRVVLRDDFLLQEFGLNISDLKALDPIQLWLLREDVEDIECDEAEKGVSERGLAAADLGDLLSSLLPVEWRLVTPHEVDAMCGDELDIRLASYNKKRYQQRIPA